VLHVRIEHSLRFWTYWIRVLSEGDGSESYPDKGDQMRWRRTRPPGQLYNSVVGDLRHRLGLFCSYSGGGGDQGDFDEESAHPKPLEDLSI
jgi:hypothetical protein